MTQVRNATGAAVALIWVIAPVAARAETLADAIAMAYRNNPTLQQQRAALRGLDENYVQAAAGLRPTIQLQGVQTYEHERLGKAEIAAEQVRNVESNSVTGQIIVTQPLYTGGRVASQIRQARSQIRAGRQGLRAAEGDLLLSVVNAYLSIRRDQQIVDVRRVALVEFVRQYDEAKARRTAGDATLTDVAQAQAELEAERANFNDAQQALQADRASYTALVGQNPGELAPEPDLPNLPADVDKAFDIAESNSPDLKQAQETELASRAAISEARAAYRPTVAIQGTYGYTGIGVPIYGENLERDLVVQAIVTQPLFTGGLNSSNIRKALEQNNSDRSGIEIARRTAIQNVATAWNEMLASRDDVATQKRQVDAARETTHGMEEEYRAGQRSTFEVLFAAETLRDAQISYLQARFGAYVAAATVLRYIGSLEARELTVGTPKYDPAANLIRVSSVGALPWDPVVQAIDGFGAPGAGQHPLDAPAKDATPAFAPSTGAVPDNATLSVTLPVTPLPGTTAPDVPAAKQSGFVLPSLPFPSVFGGGDPAGK